MEELCRAGESSHSLFPKPAVNWLCCSAGLPRSAALSFRTIEDLEVCAVKRLLSPAPVMAGFSPPGRVAGSVIGLLSPRIVRAGVCCTHCNGLASRPIELEGEARV